MFNLCITDNRQEQERFLEQQHFHHSVYRLARYSYSSKIEELGNLYFSFSVQSLGVRIALSSKLDKFCLSLATNALARQCIP